MTSQDVSKFVFVTGCDSDHFAESTDAVASIQKYFPGHQIWYFDLGLKQEQIKQVLYHFIF